MSPQTDAPPPPSAETRARIVAAASRLITTGGIEAVTTRAVAAAAGVQAPTLYRLFGDKDGLLEAVAEQAMSDYVAREGRREAMENPVQELRHAWDIYIAFSLAHPAVFRLVYTPEKRPASDAFMAGQRMLLERVRRIARTGQLRVTEELAVDLIHSVGTGTALTLLQKPPEERGGLAEAAREAVFAAILVGQPPVMHLGPASAAAALRADLSTVKHFTPGERLLMNELLERIGQAEPQSETAP